MTDRTDRAIARLLACAAITPGLRSVLVFDAGPRRFEAIRSTFTRLLEQATKRNVSNVTIRPSADDDALWGSYKIASGQKLSWQPGLLAPRSDAVSLVEVTELVAAGIETQRALVQLVGAEVASLERYGRSEHWSLDGIAWLVACQRADIGKFSPHLLDRFAMRIDASSTEPSLDAAALREIVDSLGDAARATFPDELAQALPEATVRAAALRTTFASKASIERVLSYFEPAPNGGSSPRRAIALARLSAAEARLLGASEVTGKHVESAATMLGLEQASAPPLETKTPLPPDPKVEHPLGPTAEDAEPIETVARTGPAPVDDRLQEPDEEAIVPIDEIAAAAIDISPYPEDGAPVQRDASPLAFPVARRRAAARAARGLIVGTVQAHDLSDLALVATLIEAAKYQMVRRRRKGGRLELRASDLRRYRRVPPVERMLALVLDYTALEGWDWGAAVLPYLRDAYVARAALCLVQVGAAGAASDLRAHRFVSRNLQAALLDEVLGADAGRATPLAHGLELAFETLRHALQHGRGIAVKAQLVVVSDGRGNVPLDASRRNLVLTSVGSEGVRDSLSAADKLRALDRLESVLIHPAEDVGATLPIALATALGATRRAPVAGDADS